jgi:hypothetical protein
METAPAFAVANGCFRPEAFLGVETIFALLSSPFLDSTATVAITYNPFESSHPRRSSLTYDARRICPLCAWRAGCAKRFSRGDDATLHCPDFSEDVLLRREREQAEAGREKSPKKD